MTNAAGPATADFPLFSAVRHLARALLNTTFFLAACAMGCAAIGRLAPFPEVPGIYPKWSYFSQHRDDIDLLFIGSSRFYHQIIPAQFEAAVAAAAGPRLRAFNFGYDGMWPPESFYLLRQLLALHPAHLKWVVIDLMDINTQLDDRNNSTLRSEYWHDLRHSALTARNILSTQFPWNRKLDFLLEHARLTVSQVLNLGRGAELLSNAFSPKPPRKRPLTWEGSDGYEPGPEKGMEGKLREGFVTTVDRLKRELPPQPVRPVFRDALHALITDVRRSGAEPIFVIAQTINGHENFTQIPDGAAVIALNQPNEFPELFDPAKHYDAWHLNPTGAVDFTAILARKFLERIRPAP